MVRVPALEAPTSLPTAPFASGPFWHMSTSPEGFFTGEWKEPIRNICHFLYVTTVTYQSTTQLVL
jgi:hypothetical protein